MNTENLSENIRKYTRTHDIDEKLKDKNDLDVNEILASIKKNLSISDKLTPPRYRRGGIIGKAANFVLDKFFRVTRKMTYGSLSTQDSINYALVESIERLQKQLEKIEKNAK